MKRLLPILVLAGCTTVQPPKEVDVPVSVPCKVEQISAPLFGYPQKITDNMALFDMTKILLSDINLHLGYEQLLRAAIAACQ